MNCNEAGLSIIKDFEKLRLEAYLPTPDDVWTIGYGHTRGVEEGDTCTEEEADDWLKEDLHHVEVCLDQSLSCPLTSNEYSALCCLVYNIGATQWLKSSLRKFLMDGDYDRAANEFPRWNKQKGVVKQGLVRRRQSEKELFET